MSDEIERAAGTWLVPAGTVRAPRNVSEALQVIESPLQGIGRQLHVEFSGVNLRGLQTHDVQAQRNDFPDQAHNLVLPEKSMTIFTQLTPEELLGAGPALRMFLEEIGFDCQKDALGVLNLLRYNEPIEKSGDSFQVGITPTDEDMKEGRYGFLFKSYGSVHLAPEPRDPKSITDETVQRAQSSFNALNSVHLGNIHHPLFTRALYDCAVLVGTAIWNRKKQSEYFGQAQG